MFHEESRTGSGMKRKEEEKFNFWFIAKKRVKIHKNNGNEREKSVCDWKKAV